MTNGKMKNIEVTVVRVYLSEAKAHLETLLKRLNDWGKVRGVTVFRGIAGFGRNGEIHSAELLRLNVHLPLIIEFFDEPEIVAAAIGALGDLVPEGHLLHWPGYCACASGASDGD